MLWLSSAVALFGLLSSVSVSANTEIQNFQRPLCVDASQDPTLGASRALSASWPALKPSIRPSLFTVNALEDAAQQSWVRLEFRNSSSNRFTIRASYPANHPLSVSLVVHDGTSMLNIGGYGIDTDAQPSATKLCDVAFLLVESSIDRVVRIPPASIATSGMARWRRWLRSFGEVYIGPLAPGSHITDLEPTVPVHLTLEPLIFGYIPLGVLISVVPMVLLAALVLGPWLAFRLHAFIATIEPKLHKKEKQI